MDPVLLVSATTEIHSVNIKTNQTQVQSQSISIRVLCSLFSTKIAVLKNSNLNQIDIRAMLFFYLKMNSFHYMFPQITISNLSQAVIVDYDMMEHKIYWTDVKVREPPH